VGTCDFGCVCHMRLFVVVLRSKFCPFTMFVSAEDEGFVRWATV
jgi:hypothetical protein